LTDPRAFLRYAGLMHRLRAYALQLATLIKTDLLDKDAEASEEGEKDGGWAEEGDNGSDRDEDWGAEMEEVLEEPATGRGDDCCKS